MLMALPGAPSLDVRVAAGALGVLSVGNTAERLEAIFEAMGEPPAVRGEAVTKLSSEALLELLRALMATAQVPAEKRVYVHDEGKNDLGLARSWYRVAPVPPPSPP
jgi:hypothetical protein